MIRKTCIPLAILVLLLSAGCTVLDPGPAATNVLLPVTVSVAPQSNRMPIQLRVTRPVADGATETDRIMALMNGHEVRALDSARWVNPVPALVQRHLVDALEASRRFTSVNWEGSGVEDKYRLSTDIRRFFLRYDSSGGPPVADVAMVFSLIRSETGTVVARTYAHVEEPCRENTLEAFVNAFGKATTRVLTQTVDWVVATVEAQNKQHKKGRK